MICTLCGDPAFWRVDDLGYCKFHRHAAQRAQREVVTRLDRSWAVIEADKKRQDYQQLARLGADHCARFRG